MPVAIFRYPRIPSRTSSIGPGKTDVFRTSAPAKWSHSQAARPPFIQHVAVRPGSADSRCHTSPIRAALVLATTSFKVYAYAAASYRITDRQSVDMSHTHLTCPPCVSAASLCHPLPPPLHSCHDQSHRSRSGHWGLRRGRSSRRPGFGVHRRLPHHASKCQPLLLLPLPFTFRRVSRVCLHGVRC